MILAASDAERAALEHDWCSHAAALASLFAALAADPLPWRLSGAPSSFDIACADDRPEGPRGAHLRIARHPGGQLTATFFRRGGVAGATYSYGGQAFAAAALRPDQAAAWAAYLVSGFDQSAAPRGLRRGFQFPPPGC